MVRVELDRKVLVEHIPGGWVLITYPLIVGENCWTDHQISNGI